MTWPLPPPMRKRGNKNRPLQLYADCSDLACGYAGANGPWAPVSPQLGPERREWGWGEAENGQNLSCILPPNEVLACFSEGHRKRLSTNSRLLSLWRRSSMGEIMTQRAVDELQCLPGWCSSYTTPGSGLSLTTLSSPKY